MRKQANIKLTIKNTVKRNSFYLSVVTFALLFFFLYCTKHDRDNPFDPQGTNWAPPVVTIMNDTTVAINDSFYVHAEGAASNGKITGYVWALNDDKINTKNYFKETSVDGRIKTAYTTPGLHLLTVKAIDEKGVSSWPIPEFVPSFVGDTSNLFYYLYFANQDGKPKNIADMVAFIWVNAYPPTIKAMGDTSVAINDSFYIHALGSDTNGTIQNYIWAANGAPYSYKDTTTLNNLKIAFITSGNKTILVKAIDDDRQVSSADTIIVTVHLYPPSVVAMNDTNVAINDSFFVHAEGSDTNGTIAKYVWAFDNKQFKDTTTIGKFQTVFSTGGLHNGYVKVIDDDGLVSYADSFTVKAELFPPSVTAMADTVVGIKDSFYVHALGSDSNGTIKKYLWALDGVNFKDSTDSGMVMVAFANEGVKTILVKVRDDDGLESGVASIKVTVHLYPPSVVGMSDTSVAINDSFYIHATGSDTGGIIKKHLWALDGVNFKDSTDSGWVKAAFTSAGVKTIKVKVRDDDGLESGVASFKVTVHLYPPSVVGMNDTNVGINDSFYIHATGSDTNGTIKKYLWALDGVNFKDSTDSGWVKAAFTSAGVKTIKVKVRDDDGLESGFVTLKVTVHLYPPSVIAMNDTTVVINDSFYIHATGSDTGGIIKKYFWALDGVNYKDSTDSGSVKAAFVNIGIKTVRVEVRDDDEIESLPDSVKLTVKDNPPVNIAPSKGVTITTAFPTMSWIPGWYANSFTVLLDTVNPPVAVAKSGVVDSFFTPTTALNMNKTYYWQVVGYNETGLEARGEVWMFKVVAADIDGNIYTTVKIGNQIWMVENLKTTRYNDGTAIPLVTDNTAWGNLTTPGYCWYNNDTTNKAKYGALYNWYTISTGKLAPKGWHVPTDAEWDSLANYLIANGYNWDGTITTNKIAKSMAAKSDWYQSTNTGAIGNDLTKNNNSGFTALPGGYRINNGVFNAIGNNSFWWSATVFDASNAYYRYLSSVCDYLSRVSNGGKGYGFSVRLVKDN